MLRLSRFRGRRGVLGRLDARAGIEWWNGGSDRVPEEQGTWNEDDGVGLDMPPRRGSRGMSGFAFEDGWQRHETFQSSDRYNLHGRRRGVDFGCSRMPSRGFADEPDNNEEAQVRGKDDRESLLGAIEKDKGLQEDVAGYLYGGLRDTTVLLAKMFEKAGCGFPHFNAKVSQNKYVADCVANGKKFVGTPCDTQEEAEKSAAGSVLNWVLGQQKQAAAQRGRGGGMRGLAAGRGGRLGRGGRGGGNVKRRGPAQRVSIKPRKCMHVEVNYKIMKAVVLYEPQETMSPYKEFPKKQHINTIFRS